MIRSRWMFASAIALMLVCASVYLPTFAHDDHAPPPSDGYDPFAPRTVAPATARMIGMEVGEVDFGQIEMVERMTGIVRIEPHHKYIISPRLAGTINAVNVQTGDRVRAGETVAVIQSPEYARLRYELAQLQSQRVELDVARRAALGRARQAQMRSEALTAQLQLAQSQLESLTGSGDAVSANTIRQWQSEVLTLEADAEAAQLEVELATDEAAGLAERMTAIESSRQSLGDLVRSFAGDTAADDHQLTLRAPVDGVVLSSRASVGQDVQPGDQLLEIAAMDRVQVIAELPESRLDRVSEVTGKAVRIRQARQNDVRATGTVRAVSPVVDSLKRTAHVIIEADNADGTLRDGMFVEVALVLDENDFVVVAPIDAVLSDGPERYVFIREGEQFTRQVVATGARDDRHVEILDGLVPGDEIIVRGAYAVSQIRPRGAVMEEHDHDHNGHSH